MIPSSGVDRSTSELTPPDVGDRLTPGVVEPGSLSLQGSPGARLVSVIIPTTCELTKVGSLTRAISSVLNQTHVDLEVIVVCNGPRVARDIAARFEVSERLRWSYLEEGNVSRARHAGLLQSRGEFFCFLDDDDELLPESLERRIQAFEADPEVDVVVTNGVVVFSDGRQPVITQQEKASIDRDGLAALTIFNWIGSAAPMFRARALWTDVFDINLRYFEWTYVFFDIYSRRRKIAFEDIQTYVKYEDHGASVSHSLPYLLAESEVLSQILALALPDPVKRALRKKRCRSLNVKSVILKEQEHLRAAWAAHWACLINGGYSYVFYTRHLVWASLRRLI